VRQWVPEQDSERLQVFAALLGYEPNERRTQLLVGQGHSKDCLWIQKMQQYIFDV